VFENISRAQIKTVYKRACADNTTYYDTDNDLMIACEAYDQEMSSLDNNNNNNVNDTMNDTDDAVLIEVCEEYERQRAPIDTNEHADDNRVEFSEDDMDDTALLHAVQSYERQIGTASHHITASASCSY